MVPVFKAPRVPRKDSSSLKGEEDKGSSAPWIIGGIVLLVIACAAGIWIMMSPRGASTKKGSTQNSQVATGEKKGAAERGKNSLPEDGSDANPDQPPPEEKPLALEDVRERVLGLMVAASQDPNNNRSKPFCRQATAETFAACNELENAREQIERLRDVGRNLPWYEVMPRVAVAWQELKANDLAAANKTLDEAMKAASLPKFGLESLNIATALSTVLVAAGRADEARTVLRGRSESGSLGEMATAWREAFDSQSYDFEAIFADSMIAGFVPPQWAAVSRGLAKHGYLDTTLQWAEKSDSIEIRIDCTIVWAESLADQAVRRKQPELLDAVEPATVPLGAAGKARLYARLAGRHLASGNDDQAEKSVAVAREAHVNRRPA
jgi:hypothetical protein